MAATNRPGLSRLSGATHLIGLDLADRFVESKLLSRDGQFAGRHQARRGRSAGEEKKPGVPKEGSAPGQKVTLTTLEP